MNLLRCRHARLSIPFTDERGRGYKICFCCSGRIMTPLWDNPAAKVAPIESGIDRIEREHDQNFLKSMGVKR